MRTGLAGEWTFVAAAHVIEWLDHRGRLDRAGLLAVTVLLLLADALAASVIAATGASLTSPGVMAFKAVSLWMATAALNKRLHDIGLSGWWITRGLAALLVWSAIVAVGLLMVVPAAQAANPAHGAFWVNVALTSAPVLAALLWVHAKQGTPGPNAYGPAPRPVSWWPRRTLQQTPGAERLELAA